MKQVWIFYSYKGTEFVGLVPMAFASEQAAMNWLAGKEGGQLTYIIDTLPVKE